VTRRLTTVALLLTLMAGFGLGVYTGLGHLKHIGGGAEAAAAHQPTDLQAAVSLPGVLYVVQSGDLYKLRGTAFTSLLAHGGGTDWMQPTVLPGGGLLVVARTQKNSDIDVVDGSGHIIRALTHNSAATLPDGSLEQNHWAFYPVLAADSTTVLYSFDSPKQGYLVDFAVWSRPLSDAPRGAARRWSTPNDYTGGDVQPVALPSGGVIFVRYGVDSRDRIRAQLWVQSSPSDRGHALTPLEDDCSQPSLSADATMLAMVCTAGEQTSKLETAPWLGSALGRAKVLVDGGLYAYPTWAPDGSGLAYLSPDSPGGPFQLWWLAGAASSRASTPVAVTSGLSLDASSRLAWSG